VTRWLLDRRDRLAVFALGFGLLIAWLTTVAR
jgi:hypothetical protein